MILMNAGRINAVLGRRALAAMERLMGLILTTLAVQMLMDGIGQVYLDGPAGWM